MERFFIRTRSARRGPFTVHQIAALVDQGKLPESLRVISDQTGELVRVGDILSPPESVAYGDYDEDPLDALEGIGSSAAPVRRDNRRRRARGVLRAPRSRTNRTEPTSVRERTYRRRRSGVAAPVVIVCCAIQLGVAIARYALGLRAAGLEWTPYIAGHSIGAALATILFTALISFLVALPFRLRPSVFAGAFGTLTLPFAVLLILIVPTSMIPGQSRETPLTSLNGRVSMTAPAGWRTTTGLSERAHLQLVHTSGLAGLFAFAELKSDFEPGFSLSAYCDSLRETQWVSLGAFREIGARRQLIVGNVPALRLDFEFTAEGNRIRAIAICVEGPVFFHQLYAWVEPTALSLLEPQIVRLVDSFRIASALR